MNPPRTDNPLGTFIVKGTAGPSSPILREGQPLPPLAMIAERLVERGKEIGDDLRMLRHRVELLEEEVATIAKVNNAAFDRATAACEVMVSFMDYGRTGGDLEGMYKMYEVARTKIAEALKHG